MITRRHNLPLTTESYCAQVHKLIEEDRETRAAISSKGIDYDYPCMEELIPQDSPYHSWLKLYLADEVATGGENQGKDCSTAAQPKQKLDSRELTKCDLGIGEDCSDESIDDEEEETDIIVVDYSNASCGTEHKEIAQNPQLPTITDQSVSLKEWINMEKETPGSVNPQSSDEECEIKSTPQIDLSTAKGQSKSKGFKTASKKAKRRKRK